MKRTQSDKNLKHRSFKIESITKFDDHQRGLVSMVYNFFGKKSCESGVDAERNYQVTIKLNKQIIRKFKRRKV